MGIPEIPAVDFSKFGPIETKPAAAHQEDLGPAPSSRLAQRARSSRIRTRRTSPRRRLPQGTRRCRQGQGLPRHAAGLPDEGLRVGPQAVPGVQRFAQPREGRLILKQYYHIGVAVDTPEGLVVPVIRDVDRKGIDDISQELGAVSKKARDGKLGAADMQGASFTISSLGGIGGTAFTPLVNAPEVAILGVVRSRMAPVWNGDDIQAAPDAAALHVLRPPRHRRSPGRPVHPPSRPCAGGRSPPGPLTDQTRDPPRRRHRDEHDDRNPPARHRRLQGRPGDRGPRPAGQPGSTSTIPLITLESDKATMDVPATAAGPSARSG